MAYGLKASSYNPLTSRIIVYGAKTFIGKNIFLEMVKNTVSLLLCCGYYNNVFKFGCLSVNFDLRNNNNDV